MRPFSCPGWRLRKRRRCGFRLRIEVDIEDTGECVVFQGAVAGLGALRQGYLGGDQLLCIDAAQEESDSGRWSSRLPTP